MIRSLKQIKNRIRSIENTKKVTNAMELISVSKLNHIEKMLYAIRPYFKKLDSILYHFINNVKLILSPYLEQRPVKKRIGLCVITSDGGLCGMYNTNIIRLAEEFIEKCGRDKIKLIAVGRKGLNYFKKKGLELQNTYLGLNGRYSQDLSDKIANNLISAFLTKEVDEVYIAYTHFQTALIHKPVLIKFLNLDVRNDSDEKMEYILEPNRERIIEELIPKYISMKMKLVILEAFTSEHSSRTVAMKTATDNAKDLLESLTLLRNKVRQANITQEIMEIISSSEALRG